MIVAEILDLDEARARARDEHQERLARDCDMTVEELHRLAESSPVLRRQLADPRFSDMAKEGGLDWDAVHAVLDDEVR